MLFTKSNTFIINFLFSIIFIYQITTKAFVNIKFFPKIFFLINYIFILLKIRKTIFKTTFILVLLKKF